MGYDSPYWAVRGGPSQVDSDHIGVGTSSPISERIAVSGDEKNRWTTGDGFRKIVNVHYQGKGQDVATKHYVGNLAGDGAPKATSTDYKMCRLYHP